VRKRDWENCVGVCTDGAASSKHDCLDVVAKINKVAHEEMLFAHCIIQLEHLAPKNLI